MTPRLALKIDVDTYRGLSEGAPRLARLLHSLGIPATFFVTMGPDTSGRAATRVFKHAGFMQKMQRTSAVSVYGMRTVLSGTLLPPRPMAASFSKMLRTYQDLGFEVSPHGFDHIRWHDQAARWSEEEARAELTKTFDLYTRLFGLRPTSFAAPGWQAGAGTWRAMESMGLFYHSDSRGETPYFPILDGQRLNTLEIPTTLPTWDEMLAWDDVTSDTLADKTRSLLREDHVNVWTIHAEFEGGAYFSTFESLVRTLQMKDNVQWVFLQEYAQELRKNVQAIPACTLRQGMLTGRAGTVSCQELRKHG